MRADKAKDFVDFGIPADQLGNRLRQVRRRQGRRGHPGAGALVRARRQDADLAGELVAASGDRADQLALRPKGGAQRRDMRLQIVFFDDPVGPDAAHQHVFADDRSAGFDQSCQHVEGAPADLDRAAVGKQFAAVRRKPEPTELDDCRTLGAGHHAGDYRRGFRWLQDFSATPPNRRAAARDDPDFSD
ncbi:MAG TPA: hypothetical protein VGP52_02825 [Stellaceae bacterium]|nr:hypothetical protein [Stellaceae bacterium]